MPNSARISMTYILAILFNIGDLQNEWTVLDRITFKEVHLHLSEPAYEILKLALVQLLSSEIRY